MTATVQQPEARTVQTVVIFIGAVAVLLAIGCLCLVGIVLASGKDIAASSVAVLASVTGLTGTAIGSLASMLVSTRPSPAAGDPTTFVTDPSATVTVKPADDTKPAQPPGGRTRRHRQSGVTALQEVFAVLLGYVVILLITGLAVRLTS